jgi:hypothetical protein
VPKRPITLSDIRHYAVARTLFAPTTLSRAIERLGFVQADPIRAPARAQDLTLRHRVRDYRAGDLERRYPKLAIEEDFFVNYGFLPRATHTLLHPRSPRTRWTPAREAMAAAVLTFIQARTVVHPREVDAHFQHGKAKNWFGGSSNASTQLLDQMHYRGLLRIAKREGGVRLYAARDPTPAHDNIAAAMDILVDVIVQKYAPLPERSLSELVSKLRGGAPQWAHECRAAYQRARARLAHCVIDGVTWYWPVRETPNAKHWRTIGDEPEGVRLLAPFDPIVWDRRRFEIFWGWAYRFEAYVPAPKRVRGYYALPLLWRDDVIGWANLAVKDGALDADIGYAAGSKPRERAFTAALDLEIERMRLFLAPRS